MSDFGDDDWGDFGAFDDDQAENVSQNPPITQDVQHIEPSPSNNANDNNNHNDDNNDGDDDDDEDDWGDFDAQFTNPLPVTQPVTDTNDTNTTQSSLDNSSDVKDTQNDDIDHEHSPQQNNIEDHIETQHESKTEPESVENPPIKQRTARDIDDLGDTASDDHNSPNHLETAPIPKELNENKNENADDDDDDEDEWGFDDEIEVKTGDDPINNVEQNHLEISEDDERTNDEDEEPQELQQNDDNDEIEDKLLDEKNVADNMELSPNDEHKQMQSNETIDSMIDDESDELQNDKDATDKPETLNIQNKPCQNVEDAVENISTQIPDNFDNEDDKLEIRQNEEEEHESSPSKTPPVSNAEQSNEDGISDKADQNESGEDWRFDEPDPTNTVQKVETHEAEKDNVAKEQSAIKSVHDKEEEQNVTEITEDDDTSNQIEKESDGNWTLNQQDPPNAEEAEQENIAEPSTNEAKPDEDFEDEEKDKNEEESDEASKSNENNNIVTDRVKEQNVAQMEQDIAIEKDSNKINNIRPDENDTDDVSLPAKDTLPTPLDEAPASDHQSESESQPQQIAERKEDANELELDEETEPHQMNVGDDGNNKEDTNLSAVEYIEKKLPTELMEKDEAPQIAERKEDANAEDVSTELEPDEETEPHQMNVVDDDNNKKDINLSTVENIETKLPIELMEKEEALVTKQNVDNEDQGDEAQNIINEENEQNETGITAPHMEHEDEPISDEMTDDEDDDELEEDRVSNIELKVSDRERDSTPSEAIENDDDDADEESQTKDVEIDNENAINKEIKTKDAEEEIEDQKENELDDEVNEVHTPEINKNEEQVTKADDSFANQHGQAINQQTDIEAISDEMTNDEDEDEVDEVEKTETVETENAEDAVENQNISNHAPDDREDTFANEDEHESSPSKTPYESNEAQIANDTMDVKEEQNESDEDWGFEEQDPSNAVQKMETHEADKDNVAKESETISQEEEDDWNAFEDEEPQNEEEDHESSKSAAESKENVESDREENVITNTQLPLDDIEDEEFTLSNIDSPVIVSPTKSDEHEHEAKDSDLDLRIKEETPSKDVQLSEHQEDEVIYMSEEETEDVDTSHKYDDLPKHILKDVDGSTTKETTPNEEDTDKRATTPKKTPVEEDNEFGDDDWGDFGDDITQEVNEEKKEDSKPPTDSPPVEETEKTPTVQKKEESIDKNDDDVSKEDATANVAAAADDDWGDDDEWGDFGDDDATEPVVKTEDNQTEKENKENPKPEREEAVAENEDANKETEDQRKDDWADDDAWGDDDAFEAAPPPPDIKHDTKEKHQTPPPAKPKEDASKEEEVKDAQQNQDDDQWGGDHWDDNDDEAQQKASKSTSHTPATTPRATPVVDNSVLGQIMSASEDTNVQFNALCKVLYTFGGVCPTTEEKYMSQSREYEYYAETEDENKENINNALPELAMPLSIKPSSIEEFMWDGSNIELKLYDAIQLPKPKPKQKKNKGDSSGKREYEKRKSKERTSKPPRGNSSSNRNGNNKQNRSQTATPVVEQKDNAHADVFAMFGDVFKNGTNPDKRSKNVEDVLKDIPQKKEKPANPTKAKEPKKDLLAELFGDDGITSSNDTSKASGEMDEKQKEKMRAAAAREIRKIISSIPDLSFLKNIKVI